MHTDVHGQGNSKKTKHAWFNNLKYAHMARPCFLCRELLPAVFLPMLFIMGTYTESNNVLCRRGSVAMRDYLYIWVQ